MNFQVVVLEDRIGLISKEKKNLENLVDKVSKSHPAKEMQKIVNEMLTFYDGVSQLERYKAKMEQSMKNIDLQSFNRFNDNVGNLNNNNLDMNNNSSKSCGNAEFVWIQVKIEKENLRSAIEDLNIKISKIINLILESVFKHSTIFYFLNLNIIFYN